MSSLTAIQMESIRMQLEAARDFGFKQGHKIGFGEGVVHGWDAHALGEDRPAEWVPAPVRTDDEQVAQRSRDGGRITGIAPADKRRVWDAEYRKANGLPPKRYSHWSDTP